MRRIKDAFVFLTSVLEENNIPFMIGGGFAARIYGSNRMLLDLDIWVPKRYMRLMENKVSRYVISKPRRHKDDRWDTFGMTLSLFGMNIDIAASEGARIYDVNLSRWVALRPNLNNAARKRVFGKIVPVIKVKDLIGYKNKLQRVADIRDVAYLKGSRKVLRR
jgi:hypothetical protein